MKRLFLHAKSPAEIVPSKEDIKNLPQKVGIATTVQHVHKLAELITALKKEGKTPLTKRAGHAFFEGQILGCSFEEITDAEGYLYVGDGMFHPQLILLKTEKPVYVFHPISKKFFLLGNAEIEKIKKRQKGAYLKFLSSATIGILVSTKPGQNNMKNALELQNKIRTDGKQAHIFIADTIILPELNNFPFIECWVNTMCPRIAIDDYGKTEKPILNMEDISELYRF